MSSLDGNSKRLASSTLPRRVEDRAISQDLHELERRIRSVTDGTEVTAAPPEVGLKVWQVGNTAHLEPEIKDVGNNVEPFVRFRTQSGPADETWDLRDPDDGSWSIDNVPPFEQTETIGPKHGARIAVAVPYVPPGEDRQWVVRSHEFDADHIAELSGPLQLGFDEDGHVTPSWVFDEDYLLGFAAFEKAGFIPSDTELWRLKNLTADAAISATRLFLDPAAISVGDRVLVEPAEADREVHYVVAVGVDHIDIEAGGLTAARSTGDELRICGSAYLSTRSGSLVMDGSTPELAPVLKIQSGEEVAAKVIGVNGKGERSDVFGPFRLTRGAGSETGPIIELELSQVGALGLMEVTVNDVDNSWASFGYVRFKKQSGAGEFDYGDPTDGTWAQDGIAPFSETVSLHPKHGGTIAVAVPWQDSGGVTRWKIRVHLFDADTHAELTGPPELGFSQAGKPVINWVGDEDLDHGYGTVDVAGGTPPDPYSRTTSLSQDALAGDTTIFPVASLVEGELIRIGTGASAEDVQVGVGVFGGGVQINPALQNPWPAGTQIRRLGDFKMAGRTGNVTLDGTANVAADRTVAVGNELVVKMMGVNPLGAANPEVFGPFKRRRGDLQFTGTELRTTATRFGSDIMIDHTWIDPSGSHVDIEFRIDNGAWSNVWDATPGSNAVRKTVTLTPGKDTIYEFRETYLDENGVQQVKGDTIHLSDLQERTVVDKRGHQIFSPRHLNSDEALLVSHFERTINYVQPGNPISGTGPGTQTELQASILLGQGQILTQMDFTTRLTDALDEMLMSVFRKRSDDLSATFLGSISPGTGLQTNSLGLSETIGADPVVVTLEMRAEVAKEDVRFYDLTPHRNVPTYDKTL